MKSVLETISRIWWAAVVSKTITYHSCREMSPSFIWLAIPFLVNGIRWRITRKPWIANQQATSSRSCISSSSMNCVFNVASEGENSGKHLVRYVETMRTINQHHWSEMVNLIEILTFDRKCNFALQNSIDIDMKRFAKVFRKIWGKVVMASQQRPTSQRCQSRWDRLA